MSGEFEYIADLLNQRFPDRGSDGYAKIALGEAITGLHEKELKLGSALSAAARKSFIYKTSKNKILNEIRRKKKLASIDAESSDLEIIELLETSFELAENQKLDVAKALDLLSEKRREVMVMKYLEGYTEKQIAEKLRISVYTVEERLKEAKKELRRKLGGEEK